MYVYLNCLEETGADSFVISSAVGLDSGCLEGAEVSDWVLYCCLVLSVVLVTCGDEEQVSDDLTEVDSVLDNVEAGSWALVCFSGDWLTVSLEVESFAGHGGVGVGADAGGCEAHFCTTACAAGDWGAPSVSLVSTVADWLVLLCESGTTAGSVTGVC